MLKESPRYDFVESDYDPAETLSEIRARRRKKPKGLVLPVGTRMIETAACFPLQSYLQERFSHIGRKDLSARILRAENQRRHDLAASRGGWQMSRTS
jgi:hypothetical protein